MFDVYQNNASKFFKEHTELSADKARLLDWALGVAGEAGEVTEIVKHHVYGGAGLDKVKLAKELGDVLWYISAMAKSNDIKLSTIAELNASKLDHRYHSGGFSDAESRARHEREAAFEDTFIYKNLAAKVNHTPAPLNVIFVGPDGSGKTTISKAVADELAKDGFIYHKCDYRQEDKPTLALEVLNKQANVIYDRFYYPDDIIYSRVLHERTSEEPMDWNTDYWKSYNTVLDELCRLNTVFIFVTASEDVLAERSSVWADDYVKVEELHKINELYDRWNNFIQSRPVLWDKCDTTSTPVEDCVAACVETIRRAQAIFADLPADTYLEKKEGEEDGN